MERIEPTDFLFDPPVSKKEGDFYIDGVLHCGNCKEPKQIMVDFGFTKKLMPRLCTCGKAQRDEYYKQIETDKLNQRIRDNKQEAFLRDNYKNFTFESADNKQTKEMIQARSYVEHFDEMFKDGEGILYFGNVGTGKTFISCCIANALLEKGYRVLVRNFSDIANEHFDAHDKEYVFEKYSNCNLLVIDDFAIERKTEYMGEIVYQILDRRIGNGKPIIITTNLSAQHMKSAEYLKEQRLFSRITKVCIPIKISGEDRRRKEARESLDKYLSILNGGL